MRAASIVVISVWVAAFLQAQAPAPTPAPPANLPAQAAQPPAQGGRQGSPASQRPPQSATNDAYPAEQVRGPGDLHVAGGFCHGRDAMGGETARPDALAVVAEDVRRQDWRGRARPTRRGCRSPCPTAIWPHRRLHPRSEAQGGPFEGSRRTVDVADLQTGNAQAGEQYFNGAGGCAKCHTPTGDLRLATRLQPAADAADALPADAADGAGGHRTRRRSPLLAERPGGDGPAGPGRVHRCAHRRDWLHRSWPTARVKVAVDDKLEAHAAPRKAYTDADMHNVLAHLHAAAPVPDAPLPEGQRA